MKRIRPIVRGMAVVILLFTLRDATANEQAPTASSECTQRQIEAKQRHLAVVIEELGARDVSHLTESQRAARTQALEWLARYRERGEFTENVEFPRRDMPYFIDHEGTRCALAHLIDQSGEPELVLDLAVDYNNAYISQLPEDERLAAWLERHGLTAEEIAFIQAPGTILRIGDQIPETRNPNLRDPVEIAVAPSRAGGATGSATDATPRTGGVTRRGKKAVALGLDWRSWWLLNRDAYANGRAAYHDRHARTTPKAGNVRDAASSDTGRPTAKMLSEELIPLFEAISEGDPAFASTGLMALARSADPSLAPKLVERVLAYVARPDARYEEFAILTLGVLPHESAIEPLRAILADTAKGRKILRTGSHIDDRTRSFAAIALGRIGGEAARDALLHTLEREARSSIDVAASCVNALGLVARDDSMREPIVERLTRALRDDKWNARVLAPIPIALARLGDASSDTELLQIVERFRGPREVRQSSAIALGLSGDGLDDRRVASLMITAHRDPDAATRQYAIMALGDLARAEDDPRYENWRESSKRLDRLATFYEDGISGFFKQPADRAWYALSGGLFAARHPIFAKRIGDRLIDLASKGDTPSDRAAAALALGLANSQSAIEPLRAIFAETANLEVRGYAAIALGMLGDANSKDRLLAVARSADEAASLRSQAVEGLAYHGDSSIIEPLVAALGVTKSDSVRSEMTRVIGELGDRRAVEGLRRIASDASHDVATRQSAIGALGILAQEGDLPWSSELRRGYNEVAMTDSMGIVVRIF